MCEQCVTDASMVVPDIIPGFSLMRANKDGQHWKNGWYGLVESNDPSIVFEGPLLRDETAGMADDEINALLGDENIVLDAFLTAGEKFGEALELDAYTGYRLVAACIKEGFNPKEDGAVQFWLMHHMAIKAGM